MASRTGDRTGHTTSKAVDEEKSTTAVSESADTKTEGASAPAARRRSTRRSSDTLEEAADYVRNTEPDQMARDAMHMARIHPAASLLVLSATVIGGSLLVAAMLRNQGPNNAGRSMGLSAAADGLGPKGMETLTRIRDAAFSFALARAVDTVNDMFPGFREHYEHG